MGKSQPQPYTSSKYLTKVYSALGHQTMSPNRTAPLVSMGACTREQAAKASGAISDKDTPGAIYNIDAHRKNTAYTWSTQGRPSPGQTKYPDSSNDLLGKILDFNVCLNKAGSAPFGTSLRPALNAAGGQTPGPIYEVCGGPTAGKQRPPAWPLAMKTKAMGSEPQTGPNVCANTYGIGVVRGEGNDVGVSIGQQFESTKVTNPRFTFPKAAFGGGKKSEDNRTMQGDVSSIGPQTDSTKCYGGTVPFATSQRDAPLHLCFEKFAQPRMPHTELPRWNMRSFSDDFCLV